MNRTVRQSQLFDQLVELFLADGFATLTIDALAGRLHCSKSTLYALGSTRDELVRAVVVHFFRSATEQVEADLADADGPMAGLMAYLDGVAAQLKPASAAFFDDIAASPAVREIYERNTAAAARRVAQLVAEGVECGAFRPVHVGFVGDLISAEMVRIQQRRVAAATGLDDSAAYAELAALVVEGLAPRGHR